MDPVPSAPPVDFYRSALERLVESRIPFMVGGAYALREYAGIVRDTKDLDVFCTPADHPGILAALAAAGCETVVAHPLWLAKAHCGDEFVDVIFGSGNGICIVDETWFRHAVDTTVFGVPARLIPAEEMIWSKGYVQDRARYDGADIAHVIRRRGRALDWRRLLNRMGSDWELLLAHVVNFRFVYPADRDAVPSWLMRELVARLEAQHAEPAPAARICRGTLLTPYEYEIDITEWGYTDARPLRSPGPVWSPETERAYRGPR